MYKYVVNISTMKLHIIDKCPHSKGWKTNTNLKPFNTEAEATKEFQLYIGKCKICYKDV